MRPVEGTARRRRGNWLECGSLRHVVPQVLPGFLSYALLRFSRSTCAPPTIIGFVGARRHRPGVQARHRFQHLRR